MDHAPEPVSEGNVPQSNLPRRGFLKFASGLISAVMGGVLGWPMVAALVGPIFRRSTARFVKIASMDSLPLGQPSKVSFSFINEQGYMGGTQTQAVWVIKNSPTDATVFSPICPHLGCAVSYDGQGGQFICPCHGSVFSKNGDRTDGPTPRSLDTLPSKIENGELYIKWELFKAGIAEKVEA